MAAPQIIRPEDTKDILALVGTVSGNLEVEMRFHDITSGIFERVKTQLGTETSFTEIHTTDYLVEGKRHTVSTLPGTEAPRFQVSTIIKTPVYNHISRVWWEIKLAASTEEEFKMETDSVSDYRVKASLIRDKHRWRSSWVDGKINIDLTQVTQQATSGTPETHYEIEVEIVGLIDQVSMERLNRLGVKILTYVQDTPIPYTLAQRQDVITSYNKILGGADHGSELDKKFLAFARNLKRQDCVWGGLLGGAIRYTITPKAEGHRKQLMILESGFWLVYPPMEFTWLLDKAPTNLYGTIFDGENIAPHQRNPGVTTSAKYYYLIFDIMAWNGENKIQDQGHLERLSARDSILGFLRPKIPQNMLFAIGEKRYDLLGPEPKDFYATVNKLEKERPSLPYKTDGYIFTPDSSYKSRSESLPLWQRVLTKTPDICKWKPKEELTIDFKIRLTTGEHPELLVSHWDQKREIFSGSISNPFDAKTQVLWQDPLLARVANGTIVEFGPVFPEEGKDSEIRLRPVRIRVDKTKPNRLDIAEDVWDDINRPLDLSTLEGKDFTLVRQYHNQIKRNLYQKAPGGFLVDLGAGRRGDITKQKNYLKVLAVEPNPEYNKEYLRVLSLQKDRGERVRLESCGAEDSERVVSAAISWFGWDQKAAITEPVTISMMLSLSFFFQDAATLAKLAATIQGIKNAYRRAGGTGSVRFIFLTIREAETRALIAKLGPRFALGPAEFEFKEPNILQVHIPDSIVEHQKEYLVNPDQLAKAAGLEKLVVTRATEQKFLSEAEATFTSLYVYGQASVGDRTPDTKTVVPGTPMELKPLVVNTKSFGPGWNLDTPALAALALVHTGEDVVEALEIPVLDKSESRIKLATTGTYVRIATPVDGNSWFHCILKATNPQYNSSGGVDRTKLARMLRSELAARLQELNPQYPTPELALTQLWRGIDPRPAVASHSPKGALLPLNSYYYTLQSGALHRLMATSTESIVGYDYLINLLASNSELPCYIFSYITEIISVEINIYTATTTGLELTRICTCQNPKLGLMFLEQSGSGQPSYTILGHRELGGPVTVTFPI